MGRELAIHHFSHGHRRTHTAPPSFSRSTKLQHDASLAVLRPVMESLTPVLDHPRRAEPSMNGLKHRTGAPLLFNTLLRPSPTPGRNRISMSVATHGRKRDIVRDGAVATGVPHPLMCNGCSLGTVESRGATRRCLIPCGTASPDAVPQRPDWKSLSPERPSGGFLQRAWSRMQSRTFCRASHAI